MKFLTISAAALTLWISGGIDTTPADPPTPPTPHVWTCGSDSECAAEADKFLVTVCPGPENVYGFCDWNRQ